MAVFLNPLTFAAPFGDLAICGHLIYRFSASGHHVKKVIIKINETRKKQLQTNIQERRYWTSLRILLYDLQCF